MAHLHIEEDSRIDLLFVYGSLRSAFDNPHALRLRAEAELVGEATIAGSIFRVGPFPAYRRGSYGEVRGEVYRLKDGSATLAALDAYEGELYRRIAIQLTGGGMAWVYAYSGDVSDAVRIESGDFLKP